MKEKNTNSDSVRFRFGSNWKNFLIGLDNYQIQNSIEHLNQMLNDINFKNKTFLDIGCGSGLSSLAAKKMGAKVTSFDYDQDSVDCTEFLKETYFKNDKSWRVFQGSVLDKKLLKELGEFDIVYSWGVLHHTGQMLNSFENVGSNVKKDGLLYIAIYNDQGKKSDLWKKAKYIYNKFKFARPFFILFGFLIFWFPKIIIDTVKFNPLKSWNDYKKRRGMSPYYDLVDWLGGYPFEVARPEFILRYFLKRGFQLINLKTCGGKLGCNEFIFKKQN
ncbi:MAG: class I SAM-dependent methyltransferase [Flavobacteriaceae bacterium]